jgi:hypothetical protein
MHAESGRCSSSHWPLAARSKRHDKKFNAKCSQAIKKAKWQVLVVVRSGLVARPRPPVSAGGRTGAARNSELGRGHAHAVGTALELELEFLLRS